MKRRGVDRIFFAGTPLSEMIAYVKQTYAKPAPSFRTSPRLSTLNPQLSTTKVIGFTGPGGAGKTTLIDELVLRWLNARPTARIGILSHDPSIVGKGALLGDRATMIYSQDERVFMRSLATRGRSGGLSPDTTRWLRSMKNDGFDVVFVETVGIGQEALPFSRGLVDRSIFVMGSDYGSRLQLQKIAMLDLAEVVVVNKGDLASAATAAAEMEQRLNANRRGQRVITTVAKRHRDSGVDQLFQEISA
jgi:methylmalonyl-CoA mutase